eukprot:TRINITY_DN4657_c0_g1_i1.p2 TRINITY_DN4657_c0_g1~~TRINITY_DN4657_c0_g1_i1.p2  ORF type:complete len:110 (-),score=37.68 TRINITY_DN4657_c0_g1_i1:82-411(-)
MVVDKTTACAVDDEAGKFGRLDDLKIQIEDTKRVVQSSLEKAIERGNKLEDIELKSQTLFDRSSQFERSAVQVRKQMCCQKWKWTIIISSLVLVILGLILYFLIKIIST